MGQTEGVGVEWDRQRGYGWSGTDRGGRGRVGQAEGVGVEWDRQRG